MSFPRKISATNDANKVIVQYQGIIPLKAGGEYNNNYVGIFEIKNGKIEKFTEYFDPFILENAFGKKLQQNFNVAKTMKTKEKSNSKVRV
jgi:ketosteroid isomerase-like protein